MSEISPKWPTLESRLNNPITDELTALLQLKESVPLSELGEKRLKQLLNDKNKINHELDKKETK